MKITKRLAEEQYCYIEIEFANLEEYTEGYPKFIKAYKKVKADANKVDDSVPPFGEGSEEIIIKNV